MALIQCPECGKQISDKASACPNCGYPISQAAQAPNPAPASQVVNPTPAAPAPAPHVVNPAPATPVTPKPQPLTYNQQPAQSTQYRAANAAHMAICPCCGRPSDSIKSYKLIDSIVSYVYVYTIYWRREVCCPECMRKKVSSNIFDFDHVVKGNLFWLFYEIPWGIGVSLLSMSKGHSPSVIVGDDGHVSVRK